MKRNALLILSFFLTALITACGGGGGGSKTAPSEIPTSSSAPTTSAPASSTPVSSMSNSSASMSSAPASSVSTSSTSSLPIGPTGVLWHNNYALDYHKGVQLAHLDGSSPAPITTRTDVDVSVWPDGKQYVVTYWDVYDDLTEITVIDRVTDKTVYQTQVDGYFRDVKPSPTNKNIIMARHGEDSISPFEEFVLDLSTMKVLYVISARDWFSWMPDGRFMLINIDIGDMTIASLDNTQGTVVGHLTIPEDRFMGDFSVSPNGEQILMIMNRRGASFSEPDLWIGNIDGTAFEQLTQTKVIAGASWSPDGRYIAYVTDTGSICSFGGCLGSCDQWYTPVDLRKVQGLPNTPGSNVFKIPNRYGDKETLGCSVIAWTP